MTACLSQTARLCELKGRTVNQIVLILLGWALGTLSNLLVSHYLQYRRAKRVRRLLLEELEAWQQLDKTLQQFLADKHKRQRPADVLHLVRQEKN